MSKKQLRRSFVIFSKVKRYITISLLLLGVLTIGYSQSNQDKPYHIYSIYFGGGSYYIDDEQKNGLYQFLLEIDNKDELEITVHSHTDDIGSYQYNQWLSENRGEVVTRQIMLHNIERQRIAIKDFGELNPVYDNSTMEGKMKNRRVDVILKKPVT